MSKSFDYEEFKANAIEQLKAGVPLSGKDGVRLSCIDDDRWGKTKSPAFDRAFV